MPKKKDKLNISNFQTPKSICDLFRVEIADLENSNWQLFADGYYGDELKEGMPPNITNLSRK